MPTSTVAMAVLLAAALVAVVVLAVQLMEARRRIAELEELEAQVRIEESRGSKPMQAAGLAMRTVADATRRVREQGVRGMLLASIDDFTEWALADRSEIVRVADEDGTVTFFFSDIENSTSINSELGDERWMRVLAAHDELVTTYLDKHRGHVVKTQGDGYMVAFSTPERAAHAALDIQRAFNAKHQRDRRLRRTPIKVRIGLHRGTAVERDGDWYGRNVAMAARIAAVAEGGEVLVSDEVAERLRDEPDVDLTPTEPVELKGIPGEHVLWMLEES
jgi:class 3 adenylate cyclase